MTKIVELQLKDDTCPEPACPAGAEDLDFGKWQHDTGGCWQSVECHKCGTLFSLHYDVKYSCHLMRVDK